MARLLQDLRYGFWMLAKNPGFSAVAIITLALGIGANSAIFTLTYAVILKSLPVPNPGELVRYTFRETGVQDLSISGPAYEALRKTRNREPELARLERGTGAARLARCAGHRPAASADIAVTPAAKAKIAMRGVTSNGGGCPAPASIARPRCQPSEPDSSGHTANGQG